jgi:Selenocysteine-specific translation elongation factor
MLDGSFKLSRHYDPNKFNFSFDFWTRVRVYIGAREIMARVVPLGNDNQIVPDAENYVQLRLEEPIAVKKGDKFILRSYSPMILLGGGEILDANPDKHKKTDTL